VARTSDWVRSAVDAWSTMTTKVASVFKRTVPDDFDPLIKSADWERSANECGCLQYQQIAPEAERPAARLRIVADDES
jgi:hypothetical protein